MIFKQYYLGCLAHASYLIGDETTGAAAVVDPQRDIEQYLADARAQGLSIRHVFLTHFHADFVAGHLELRDRAGAEIVLGAKARAAYPFRAMKDGEALEMGDVRLSVLETPGHTPEGISILVFDRRASTDKPHAVLTGDTLFIGDVGRPDLMASVGTSAEELAKDLYQSLRQKILALPDDTLVYPAHGAGSMCGKNLSKETVSTIGAQRKENYACQPMDSDEFVRLVTADQPEAPRYFAYDATLNRSERPTLDQTLAKVLTPLSLPDVLALREKGAQLLDVRDPSDWAGAHLLGAWNIGLSGKFATWCGTLLGRKRPIVLIAEPGREMEAAMRLGRIGFDHVAGYLETGMEALAGRPDLLAHVERVTATAIRAQLRGPDRPLVLDVRNVGERAERRIEGTIHIPLAKLPERAHEIPEGPLVIHCATGYRSCIATSILESMGRTGVSDLVGGIAAFEGAGSCAAAGQAVP